MATVRYFAAAAEAAGTEQEQVSAGNVQELVSQLTASHGTTLAEVLRRSSLLHQGRHVSDPATRLTSDSVVDVLPPFAGG
ncbi:MoaD/ThiS family protein [Ornithinimicrobium sp. F0845]|uniref:MoaD/ThiS family protein n=1 Tax=Ornithinimicrobium sp. F0845 TaxID=2926412 RepID=UPI001FF2520C|nr:MoaD/ThiS family protein [Ornithinimicrobium sp. F0845]MCK0113187.1 MoaD/ThiS family protein [Ornithinimicrobium sp. F0845]